VSAGDCLANAPIGGKARALGALAEAELPIPPWFALVPAAFYDSLTQEQQCTLNDARDQRDILKAIESLHLNQAVQAELGQKLSELCPNAEPVAVRSSASDEDGPEHSFAGQLDSFLFVPPGQVADKVIAVWRSGYSDRIFAYRREHGLDLLPRAPSVLIQRMVNADTAGVAFGADPVTGRRGVVVVSAVYGLGTALVSGEADADTYEVSRDHWILSEKIADKRTGHRWDAAAVEGVSRASVAPERSRLPALNSQQIIEVACLARCAARFFGRPQDIEWAFQNDQLFLLQSRPITSLANLADPDGVFQVWDNSNIAESYNGITTPLTFSFARKAYEGVYREFCKLLRVPGSLLAEHEDIFPHMLGLIRGRVYYNLLNWYRLLILLPGFTFNRKFMEQMMGVKEGLPGSIDVKLPRPTWRARVRDGFRFLVSGCALVGKHFTLRRQIKSFYRRLNYALGDKRPDLEPLRPDELAAIYRDLERRLLTRWDAPLVNDFFAMIFYGVLRKLTGKWCQDEDGTLQNDLICAEGGIISAEPAIRIREMGKIAGDDPALVDALCDGPLADCKNAMKRAPAFQEKYESYLEKFGDRCLEELKLESSTLFDEPLTLLRSIGQMARRLKDQADTGAGFSETRQRQLAEERVRRALHRRPLKRLVFRWVLKHARARVRDRENLRFERTRLFGRVRSLFVELGRKLHALDLLEHPRDVFYLEVNEVLGFVDGTTTTTNLKDLALLRKTEFDRYRQMEAPADRFETRGMVHQGNSFRSAAPSVAMDGETRKGIGCCPGIVRGPVRVITDPRNATLQKGDILVAERTDPGWIMLFPACSALLVERGSLLSHSAIVAREMCIPAIVSIPEITRWLKDGDQVEMDGSTGVIRKV
jgi:pyruvate,water dikinase